MMLLPDLLHETAMKWPHKPAAVFQQQQVTFSALEKQSFQVATRLQSLGIGPGSRVAIIYDNTPEALAYFWGILKSGAATVDIPASAGHAAIESMLEEARPNALAIQSRHLKKIIAQGCRSCPPIILSSLDAAAIFAPLAANGALLHVLEDIAQCGQIAVDLPRCDPASVAMIIYTSGTTGRPKGVMLTHQNLLFNIAAFNSRIGLTCDDDLLLIAPLYYIHGRIQLLTHAMTGGTIFFSMGFQFPQTVLDELASYAPTGISGVPYHFSTLLRHTRLKETPLPRLRNITITGGALAPAALHELQQAVPGAAIHVNYGQTEASPRLTYLGPSAEVFERPTSCGRPLPGVTIEILAEDGTPLPPGHVGQVVASGAGIMKGYVSGDERTSGRIDAQGRLHTGDLGHLDADGYLYLVGRSSEMIKSAGERMFPREIEEVIQLLPGVQESAVFGVPDPILGERVVACIVPAHGHEIDYRGLKTHCLKYLPHVRTPKDMYILPEIPKTFSGKVRRDALQSSYRASRAPLAMQNQDGLIQAT